MAETQTRSTFFWAIAVISLAHFTANMGSSLVNVSLPAMSQEYGIGSGVAVWVVIAYGLVLSSFLLTFGKAGDVYGFKRVFSLGMVVFAVGSLVGGFAPSIEVLIVARAVQALGTAMYLSLAFALVAILVPKGEMGRSIGTVAMFGALGFALGPLIGGVLTQYAGWRWALLINVPLALVTLVLTKRFLPEDIPANPGHRFDRAGSALLFLALFALIFPINMGQTLGWTSPWILGSFGLSAVLFMIFAFFERRAQDPVMRPDLFRNKGLLRTNLLTILIMLPYAGSLVVLPFYFENVRSIDATDAGILIMSISLGVTVFGPVAGRASDRYGTWKICMIGIAMTAAGSLLLLTLNPTTPILVILASSSLIGCGVGVFNPAAFQYVLTNSPKEVRGSASGMLQTSRRTGTVIGVAVMSAIYNMVFAGKDISNDSANDIAVSPDFLHGFALGTGMIIILIGSIVALAIALHDGRKVPAD